MMLSDTMHTYYYYFLYKDFNVILFPLTGTLNLQIILDGKAQLRIDLRQTSNQSVTSMSVTLQVSGFYTDKTEGLCGYIRNETLYHKSEKQTNQPIVDWR